MDTILLEEHDDIRPQGLFCKQIHGGLFASRGRDGSSLRRTNRFRQRKSILESGSCPVLFNGDKTGESFPFLIQTANRRAYHSGENG